MSVRSRLEWRLDYIQHRDVGRFPRPSDGGRLLVVVLLRMLSVSLTRLLGLHVLSELLTNIKVFKTHTEKKESEIFDLARSVLCG